MMSEESKLTATVKVESIDKLIDEIRKTRKAIEKSNKK